MLNSLKKIVTNLKNWYFTIIFFLLGLAFIPLMSEDVFAITHHVIIPEESGTSKLRIHFWPSEITVSVDDKVQWYNTDTVTHTVTSGSFQGGPDGIFNSGILEPDDLFIYQPTLAELGKLSYYCTIHPWMNGIITVLDPEGLPVGRVAEAGSLQAAQNHLEEAKSFVQSAKEFVDLGYDNQAAVTYIQAGFNFENAALEYALLDDHSSAAKYYDEAAIQHQNAALHLEKSQDFTKSIIHHHTAGVQHHFAGVHYKITGDHKSAGKHFAEALTHKGMAKFGSDYVLPPKHQVRLIVDASDITCKEGLELIQKSSTKEPACVKPSSVEKLIERGWAIKA
jgi:plastocyanin